MDPAAALARLSCALPLDDLANGARLVAGLPAFLRQPRYVNANCFAQPSTPAGRDLMIATGFRPIASSQPDLWCYERPWKRLPPGCVGVSSFSAGSVSDARH